MRAVLLPLLLVLAACGSERRPVPPDPAAIEAERQASRALVAAVHGLVSPHLSSFPSPAQTAARTTLRRLDETAPYFTASDRMELTRAMEQALAGSPTLDAPRAQSLVVKIEGMLKARPPRPSS